jgi:phosphoribosylaminoimidazole-succinocarboxamide synthase
MGNWVLKSSGKVRDLYLPTNPDEKKLLLVASDRISAFDYILPSEIPNKGKILNQLSLFWFDFLKSELPNHLLPENPPAEFANRAVVVKPLQMFPIEAVVRGYLTGSGWAEYQKTQSVCGIPLPPGLKDGSKLPYPIFTPATKAPNGEHDMNITFEQMVEIIGLADATHIRDLSIKVYELASVYALECGIIIADTKLEFGKDETGQIVLGDEVLTPDSSRFWELSSWEPGRAQPSFDKQFVRDYLLQSGWDKASTPPGLPDEVIEKTFNKYKEALEKLTKRSLQL